MDIYRIYVALIDVEPPIWRRIELSSRSTLKQLHRILQIAMGWENYHLHEFIVGKLRYGVSAPDDDEPGEVISEGRATIAEVLTTTGTQMQYNYDFGDCWQHVIKLEEVGPAADGREYPTVADGARSCPPEDCGGTGGYADLLDILLDPTHEEYAHMRAWAGVKFNAEVFSKDSANLRLKRSRSLACKR